MTVYLIIDESGEKGYSTRMDTNSNKFGTMVGYFLFDFQIEFVRKILKNIFSSLKTDGKLHITDLSKEEQNLLRKTALEFLKQSNISWIHTSIYNEGFKNYSDDKKLLLHSTLFTGVFIKAISYIKEFTRTNNLNLKVISDTLDKKTIKQFDESVYLVKELMCRQKEIITVKKDYTIKTTVNFSDDSFLLDELTIDITCEDTELTLIADVLSNTTYYFLNQELKLDPDTNLNSYHSLKNHPIQSLLYGCYDHTKKDSINFLGTLYRK